MLAEIFPYQNLKSRGGPLVSAERIEGDFYAAQKLPLLLRAREQSDAKNCRHSPRDQMSAQKAKWTWHGRANIYTGGGFYMSKLFTGTGPPPHLAM